MPELNLNINKNYKVIYKHNGKKIKKMYKENQIINVDSNSIVKLYIYNDKNVFITILKNALYGFIEIFLFNNPSFKHINFKKYKFKVFNEEYNISILGYKLNGVSNYKTYHLDLIINLISFISILLILALVIFIAIKIHWFELKK